MTGANCGKMRVSESKVRFLEKSSCITSFFANGSYSPILPGLPDDVAKCILALVPRSYFPAMSGVNKKWRSFIRSKEFILVRKLAGLLQEWLYVLTADADGKESYWEVLDCLGNKHRQLPQMPVPIKAGFGVAVLNGNLLVIGGYSMVDGPGSASPDVFLYGSCLNRLNVIYTNSSYVDSNVVAGLFELTKIGKETRENMFGSHFGKMKFSKALMAGK
ncbi:hypothetical protein DM860_015143 [Cuscuta australis]|uniref:F-box domain-containing protein n=1 Tax=Cuscuta australis TaxID=267555 RepID=A0A328DH05_9ASTE|nr:hypothetical protein DM860_015143 [Cuscuta australis]